MRKTGIIPMIAVVAGVLGVGVVGATEDYTTWGNWKYVYLITNNNGAKVTGAVTNFPVLVRLNPGNFDGLANTSDSGSDVRFSDSLGNPLRYHIERWKHVDANTDTGEIWVLVPTVKGSDTTKIKMYWNKPGVVDSSNAKMVFDTLNGFRNVWHLGENPAGPAPQFIDTTGRVNNGTALGSMPSSALVDGAIGKGITLDGVDDRVSTATNITNPTVFTFSGWFKTNTTTGGYLTAFGENQQDVSSSIDRGVLIGKTGKLFFAVWNIGRQYAHGSKIVNDNNWHHFAARLSGAGMALFVDGELDSLNTGVTSASPHSGWWKFGMEKIENWLDEYMPEKLTTPNLSGGIDEFRYDSTERSAGWIKLCYQNQRLVGNRDSLVWFGTIQNVSSKPGTPIYKRNPLLCYSGITITPDSLTASVGTAKFTVFPPLPTGIILDSVTGVISGSSTVITPLFSFKIKAANASGADSVILNLSITTPPALSNTPKIALFIIMEYQLMYQTPSSTKVAPPTVSPSHPPSQPGAGWRSIAPPEPSPEARFPQCRALFLPSPLKVPQTQSPPP